MSEQDALNLQETGSIESVDEYKFEPIKGYPMLQWHGKRPFTSTQYYPAQKKEVYGEEVGGWINKIFWGDNLQVMSHLLKEYRGKVNLIYIDPPFDSKADYKKEVKVKGGAAHTGASNFEEKQYTDIWTNDGYLQFMYERIVLLRELLSDEGSLFLQCDWHKSHQLRCILDEVFGSDNFVNQIVWKRGHAHSDSKQGSTHLGRLHEEILYYRKTAKVKFNQQYTPYEQSYIDKYYRFIDEDTGRRYWTDNLQGPGGAAKGNPYYEVMGVSRYWRYSKEKMERLIAEGRVIQTKPGTVPKYKRYLDEMPGRPVQDVWDDIKSLAGMGASPKERLGYPTQKPEALLERIIKTSTDEGDIVFDCFMGSGTCQSVAMKLGRKFLGADINLGAVQITTKRLLSELSEGERGDILYPCFEVYNVNNYDVFRNPVEAKALLLEALEIEEVSGTIYDGEKDGSMVKLMPVNRIATREDLNDLVANFPYKVFDKRKEESPNKPVESIMLVCMGHEPDLKAHLEQECGYKLNVRVVDILRDKSNIEFKRDSEAVIKIEGGDLVVSDFYPMNLMQKLSLQKESVSEWRELVESVVIDWNYDGSAMEPSVVDVPDKENFVQGVYTVPDGVGTIKIKITDLLSESYEEVIKHG